jgi:predicted nuclease of predicted toxin-antitoxin system
MLTREISGRHASAASIAAWLVGRGFDAVHATDIGLHRAPDSEIVARAKQEARTIITIDLDYPRLLAIARSVEPSLILFRNGDWTEAEVRSRLDAILSTLSADDIAQSIIVVDRDRVRRRRLPIT